MILTVLYVLYAFLIFCTSFFTLPVYAVLRLFRAEKASAKYLNAVSSWVGRRLIKATGSKVNIQGKENLPDSDQKAICIISNHQSFFDIPLLTMSFPFPVGFIAKKSLGRIIFLKIWMMALHCVLIDRKSPKSSIRAIEKGVLSIKKGRPMLIFPEGTRSKSSVVGKFKKGALKLATRSDACIIPVSIDYVYKLFEETGKIKKHEVKVFIHPPIYTNRLSEDEKDQLADRLQAVIESEAGKAQN